MGTRNNMVINSRRIFAGIINERRQGEKVSQKSQKGAVMQLSELLINGCTLDKAIEIIKGKFGFFEPSWIDSAIEHVEKNTYDKSGEAR